MVGIQRLAAALDYLESPSVSGFSQAEIEFMKGKVVATMKAEADETQEMAGKSGGGGGNPYHDERGRFTGPMANRAKPGASQPKMAKEAVARTQAYLDSHGVGGLTKLSEKAGHAKIDAMEKAATDKLKSARSEAVVSGKSKSTLTEAGAKEFRDHMAAIKKVADHHENLHVALQVHHASKKQAPNSWHYVYDPPQVTSAGDDVAQELAGNPYHAKDGTFTGPSAAKAAASAKGASPASKKIDAMSAASFTAALRAVTGRHDYTAVERGSIRQIVKDGPSGPEVVRAKTWSAALRLATAKWGTKR